MACFVEFIPWCLRDKNFWVVKYAVNMENINTHISQTISLSAKPNLALLMDQVSLLLRQSKTIGFTPHSTARVILGQALSIVTCGLSN